MVHKYCQEDICVTNVIFYMPGDSNEVMHIFKELVTQKSNFELKLFFVVHYKCVRLSRSIAY